MSILNIYSNGEKKNILKMLKNIVYYNPFIPLIKFKY